MSWKAAGNSAWRAPRLAGLQGGGEDAAHRPEFPAQGQLAEELQILEKPGIQLPGGGQDAWRDGQVEAAAFLGQVGRRQIHRQLAGGQVEPGVDERAPEPILALAHGCFGKTHDVQPGQTIRLVYFDSHRGRVNASLCTAMNLSEHDYRRM